jgi:hypothetical protein
METYTQHKYVGITCTQNPHCQLVYTSWTICQALGWAVTLPSSVGDMKVPSPLGFPSSRFNPNWTAFPQSSARKLVRVEMHLSCRGGQAVVQGKPQVAGQTSGRRECVDWSMIGV